MAVNERWFWRPEDDIVIRTNVPEMTADELGTILGRTAMAVQHRAWRLGLRWKSDHPERFWRDVLMTHVCWLWQGRKDRAGYGRYYLEGRYARAHRVAYELMVGPIPAGLTLDHLCRNPACVNPAHLEPCTSRENTLRGETRAARNARKTHCPRGHAYTPENTYTRNGKRWCRACEQMRHARCDPGRKR